MTEHLLVSFSASSNLYSATLLSSMLEIRDIFLALWPCASALKKKKVLYVCCCYKVLMELIFHTDFPHTLFHNLNYLNCARKSKPMLCNKSLKGCICQQQYFRNHQRQTNSHSFIGNIKPMASAKILGLRELTNILPRPKGMSGRKL